MNIFVVRHGITEWNLQGKAQGREDIPLCEGGIAQARACGELLQGLSIDHLVSSPLMRAQRTAEIIGEYLKLSTIDIMEAFTERDLGRISGALRHEIEQLRASGTDLQMESRRTVHKRAMAGVEELHQRYGDCNVMIVTHGALIRNMVRQCVEEKKIPPFFENCGICLFSYDQGELKLKLINLLPQDFVKAYEELGT